MARLRGVTDIEHAVDRAIGRSTSRRAAPAMDTYRGGCASDAARRDTGARTDILVLDEPLNGADPRQRVHFKHLLQTLADEADDLVLSSHSWRKWRAGDTMCSSSTASLAASGGYRRFAPHSTSVHITFG